MKYSLLITAKTKTAAQERVILFSVPLLNTTIIFVIWGDRLEVNLESGETKQFDEYEEFIGNWRFWFAAGKPYKSDEETFAKMVESLKAFYVDGASLEILLNGLYVKMIFHRWK